MTYRKQDSNLRPPGYEPDELTTALSLAEEPECCVTMDYEKVLNLVQAWLPGFCAIYHYTKLGMASRINIDKAWWYPNESPVSAREAQENY